MSKAQKTWRTIIVAVPVICFLYITFYFSFYPDWKYHIGMSLEEAQSKMRKEYPVMHVPRTYLNRQPSAAELENDPMYVIKVKDELVFLEFNCDKKLKRIRKWWQAL